MRRFRREGVHHYGSAGAERLYARRRAGNFVMADRNAPNETDNGDATGSIPANSGGEVVREDGEAPEGQSN